MLNVQEMNDAFIAIVEKKQQLKSLNPAQPQYELCAGALAQMEKSFMAMYGAYLEEAIFNVHDEYCPDNDVMLPLAYMASSYLPANTGYKVPPGEGIVVSVDDFLINDARLVLVPNPVRLELQNADGTFAEIVWKAG